MAYPEGYTPVEPSLPHTIDELEEAWERLLKAGIFVTVARIQGSLEYRGNMTHYETCDSIYDLREDGLGEIFLRFEREAERRGWI